MSTATTPPSAESAPPQKRSAFKTVLLTVLRLLVVFVAVVLVLAAMKPAEFRVERSIVINAPPEKITPHLNDLKKWGSWSPWEKIDPNMKREFSGLDSGVGAKYAWDGNNDIGAGRIEIIESTPEKVAISLEFTRPMAAKNEAEFVMVPEANGTKLTWAMYGPNTFMGKVIQVFLSMDSMCGTQFDEGLKSLKGLAEATN